MDRLDAAVQGMYAYGVALTVGGLTVAKAWIQVRLTRETMSLLQLCKGWFMSDRSSAPAKLNVEVDRFGLSVDGIVNELIRRELAHRARSKRASEKRRQGRQKPQDVTQIT